MKYFAIFVFAFALLFGPAHAGAPVCSDDQPSSDTAAVATIANAKNYTISGTWVLWSYSTAPTGGKLTIKSASTTIAEVDITAAGPGFLPLDGLNSVRNEAYSATLAAGGTGVSGKVTMCAIYK